MSWSDLAVSQVIETETVSRLAFCAFPPQRCGRLYAYLDGVQEHDSALAARRRCCHIPDRRASSDDRCAASGEQPTGHGGRTARQSARWRARTARLAGVHAAPFSRKAVIHGLRVPVHLTSRDALRMFDLA